VFQLEESLPGLVRIWLVLSDTQLNLLPQSLDARNRIDGISKLNCEGQHIKAANGLDDIVDALPGTHDESLEKCRMEVFDAEEIPSPLLCGAKHNSVILKLKELERNLNLWQRGDWIEAIDKNKSPVSLGEK
jgi:hypothetical protein